METLNGRGGFLCNFEILKILKLQSNERNQQTKLIDLDKKLNYFDKNDEKSRIRPENLNTVTFECIKYLEEEVHPFSRQTKKSIQTALDNLERLDLTKSERLQIINLAPASLCELTVCIEEYETRFPLESEAETLLSIVKDSSDISTLSLPDGDDSLPLMYTNGNGNGIGKTKKLKGVDEWDEEDHPAEEEEEEEVGEEEEEDEFVNEGLAGEGESNVRELDEGE